MTSSQNAPAQVRQRDQWVDNLRVAVIAGVVVMHATTAYLGGADWYYTERTASVLWSDMLVLPAGIAAIFGLAPLFLLAGSFSARSLARQGPGPFARSRLLRLGLPLLAFVYLIDPLAAYVGELGRGGNRSLAAYLGVREAAAGPMWFVAALLAISLAYALLRRLRPIRTPRPRPAPVTVVVVAIVVLTAVCLAVWPLWPPDSEGAWLNLRWGLWPQGAVLFALGAYAGEDLAAFPPALARRLGWVALACLGVMVTVGAFLVGDDQPSAAWFMVLFAVLYGVISIGWTLWLVWWARGRWSADGPLLARAGRASYATYVLHPLTLTTVMVVFAAVSMPAGAKFLLVSAISVPACFAVGYGLARLPGVSRVL